FSRDWSSDVCSSDLGGELLSAPGLVEITAFSDEEGVPVTLPDDIDGEEATDLTLEDLIVQANEQFEQAQTYAREGDWAGYGEARSEERRGGDEWDRL